MKEFICTKCTQKFKKETHLKQHQDSHKVMIEVKHKVKE